MSFVTIIRKLQNGPIQEKSMALARHFAEPIRAHHLTAAEAFNHAGGELEKHTQRDDPALHEIACLLRQPRSALLTAPNSVRASCSRRRPMTSAAID